MKTDILKPIENRGSICKLPSSNNISLYMEYYICHKIRKFLTRSLIRHMSFNTDSIISRELDSILGDRQYYI